MFLRDRFRLLAENPSMNTTLTLAKQFEASAAQTEAISAKAKAINASTPSDVATEIAAIATAMTTMSERIASTLRASLLRAKKAA